MRTHIVWVIYLSLFFLQYKICFSEEKNTTHGVVTVIIRTRNGTVKYFKRKLSSHK